MTIPESKSKLKVLGVGSSMRHRSYSTAALKLILEQVMDNEAEAKLLDLQKIRLPMLYSRLNGLMLLFLQHQIIMVLCLARLRIF